MLVFLQISLPFFLITYAWERVATFFVLSTLHCTLEIVSTEEGTFNFWAQEVTEHRKYL